MLLFPTKLRDMLPNAILSAKLLVVCFLISNYTKTYLEQVLKSSRTLYFFVPIPVKSRNESDIKVAI